MWPHRYPLAADQPEGDDAALASAGLIQHENDRETARNLAHPASEALRKRRRQSHERIFTTTSRVADMAGDEPAVQREWTRAGAGRLQDKGSKLADSRHVHTHR